jgi:copper chaperone NosL
MTIIDPAFAGQLVTRTGRVYVFDDFVGLAAFQRDNRVPPDEVHGVWANLYLNPDQRIGVNEAVFLKSDRLRSPMSSGLAAFASSSEADSLRSIIGGELLDWDEVLRQESPQASGS